MLVGTRYSILEAAPCGGFDLLSCLIEDHRWEGKEKWL